MGDEKERIKAEYDNTYPLDPDCDCARFIGGKQKNVEAAIRFRANGKIKKLLNGYKVQFAI